MRMSNSPSHRLLDQQRLLAQSHYRNSISPSSTYNSEDEDHHSDNSKSGILSNAQQAVVNSLLGNTNHNSSNSNIANNNQVNNNQFPFNAMNGSNNQNDLQQAVAQQAANAAAAQLSAQIRKLQQHHNQLNNSSNTNGPNSALAAAAAQLTNSNTSNSFSNYSAFYNAAAAALNGSADLPLLNNLANSLASVKNSVNSSHSLANALNNSNGQTTSSSNGSSQQSPYIATNQYTEITYKGQQVAAFYAAAKNPSEYLLCLPQAFELFLKHLVGGLHTVYTKLKRLDIVPIVCNVEQVRILRSRGAIQPGVNRCKLLSTKDFDILYKDCTTARSGRPARPNEDAGLLPNCGDVDLADCEVSCDERQSRRVLARLGNRLPDSLLKRHKTDLDNNMLPLLFANEDSGQGEGGTESSHRSSPNGQLLSPAAAAALRFAVRNSPGISSLQAFNGSSNNLQNSGNNSTSNTNNSNQVNSNQNNSSNQSNNNSMLGSADFNATAAYIWLLSQQQQQQQNNNSNNNSNRNSSSNGLLNGDLLSSTPNTNANHNSSTNGQALSNNALSALNLTRGLAGNGSGNTNANQNSTANNSELLNNTNNKINNHQLDESTDEDDDQDDEMDDSELRSSHSNLSNSIDNHQSLFNGFGKENRTDTPNNEQINNILGGGSAPTLLNNNKENDSTKADNKELPFGQLGLSNLINNNDELFRSLNRSNNSSDTKNSNQLINSQNINTIANNLISNTDSLESYLRNIGNLISIAAQNARHQQEQLNLHKAELRAELLNVVEKERDFREQLERQLNQEQKFRLIYQKRFKKERRIRKKIEQDLQQVQNQQIKSDRNSPTNEKSTPNSNGSSSPIKQQQNKINENLDNGNSPYGSPVSANENLKENTNEEKDCEMAVD